MSFSAFASLGAYQEKVRCGYCGSEDTAHSYGFYSPLMTVQAYEAMLNRGWRRYVLPK
jgi:arginyl-tRNA---protein transferase